MRSEEEIGGGLLGEKKAPRREVSVAWEGCDDASSHERRSEERTLRLTPKKATSCTQSLRTKRLRIRRSSERPLSAKLARRKTVKSVFSSCDLFKSIGTSPVAQLDERGLLSSTEQQFPACSFF